MALASVSVIRLTVAVDSAELEAEYDSAIDDFVDSLGEAVRGAARAGIEEARVTHPYIDRTMALSGTATTEDVATEAHNPGCDMVWPMEYAGYVDEGTTRSRPFPFTPIAATRCEEYLDRAVDLAGTLNLEARLGR